MKLTNLFTVFFTTVAAFVGCTGESKSDKKAVISHGKMRMTNIDDHVCAVDAAKAVLKFQVDKLTKEGFANSLQIFESTVDKAESASNVYEGTVSFKVILAYENDLNFLVRIKQEEGCRVVAIDEIK